MKTGQIYIKKGSGWTGEPCSNKKEAGKNFLTLWT